MSKQIKDTPNQVHNEKICKLCLQSKKLCKSHIIQKSMYQYVNVEKYRSQTLTIDTQIKSFVQNGVTEDLLCKECENKFSLYEKYLAEITESVIQQNPEVVVILSDPKIKVKIFKLDYQKFKYAILLHLWRLSIHDNKKGNLSIYQLGKYQEILRVYLLNETPFLENCFPIAIGELNLNGEMSPLIATFPRKKIDGISVQQFSFGSLHFVIYMQEQYLKFNQESFLFIREDGYSFVANRDVMTDVLDEKWKQSIVSYAKNINKENQ